MPIDHVNIPVADLEPSRAFYGAALAPLGFRLVYEGAESLGFGRGDGGDDDEPIALRVGEKPGEPHRLRGREPSPGRGVPRRGVAAGGRDNGAPGERPYGPRHYAAFVLDPDGHNIEAVYKGGP